VIALSRPDVAKKVEEWRTSQTAAVADCPSDD
jgi:hypothetical protein